MHTNFRSEKPEEKRLLGRQRRRWEDISGMDVREIGLERVKWMHLAQDREKCRGLMNMVMNIRVV
jgi:hypothetical protein